MMFRKLLLSAVGFILLAGAVLPANAEGYHHRRHHRHHYHHHR